MPASSHQSIRSAVAVTIERCAERDIGDVVRFLDEHWQRGHALVASRRLLDWQHRNPDGSYSFVVARVDGACAGILGYIPTRRFDPALAGDNVVWLTTWKVREDAGVAGLGLAMLHRLTAIEPHVAIGASGFNVATRPIYDALGFAVGELEHYARANPGRREFALASFSEQRGRRSSSTSAIATRALSTAADFERAGEIATGVPRKTARYFHARYACHPLYSYRVLAIEDGGRTVALLATRIAEHAGHRALRIVDFAGAPEAIAALGGIVDALLEETGAEYADVYHAGLDPSLFARAGFTRVDPDGADVVPDHFEPFERRNVRLWFAIKGRTGAVVFKGDGDQDRPNIVRDERR